MAKPLPNEKELRTKVNRELSEEEILYKLRRALAQEFRLQENKIHFYSHFREDLDLDSIDAVRVIMALEEEFNFEIPDEDSEGVTTVREAVEYIAKRLRQKGKGND